jgi:hypothetical protein
MKTNRINKAKLTLPYYISTFGVVEVKLFLEYIRAIVKLTSDQVKGYKASLNDTNYINILNSAKQCILSILCKTTNILLNP